MKIIITNLLFFVLFGCGSGNDKEPEPPVIPEVVFNQIYPLFETRADYFGVYEQLNDNSWFFKSHLIDYPVCERAPKPHYCKKIGAGFEYTSDHVSGLETKYSFDVNVTKFNMIDPPYFIIVWQDWFDYDPDDDSGNHPFSTLKLKVFDNDLYLAAYNNKWQWDYSFFNPIDPNDPADNDHGHPENTLTGKLKIELNTSYHIDILVKDGVNLEDGETIVMIDGALISQERYQTKPISSFRTAALQWGMYWDRDYNPDINLCATITGLPEKECKSNQLKFENFNIFERVVTD